MVDLFMKQKKSFHYEGLAKGIMEALPEREAHKVGLQGHCVAFVFVFHFFRFFLSSDQAIH